VHGESRRLLGTGVLAIDDARIRAERTRILYSNLPAAVTAAGVALLSLIGFMLWRGQLPPLEAAVWAGSAMGCVALLMGFWKARRRDPAKDARWRVWLLRFRVGCLAGGAACGAVAVLFPSADRYEGAMFGALVAGGSVAGALPFIGADLAAFAAYLVPTMSPYVLSPLLQTFPGNYGLAASAAAYIGAMWWAARRSSRQLGESLRLRFENLDLLEEVSRQKALAEEASAAKSQFLAAASHDLRQPLHALSLFVGALGLRRMDREGRRLLDQVGQSVAAMDALFADLFDITRLEAGATRVELIDFPLRPLLERLGREFRAEAQAKGLSFRIRCGEQALRSDPALVERILRNLIANAVRYTDRGGVLAACRRAGDNGKVRLEVWDTGRGVSADQQAKIFREFYQLAGPGQGRPQGLGLGLAIVQRTAALLGGQVSLASRPGRGSVFRLDLPRSTRPALQAAREGQGQAHPAAKGLILVLEDEAPAREAMSRLLTGWGHEVLAAESASEMLRRLDGRTLQPDLIICDFGLGGGENGVETVRTLRERAGAEAPAILVSGDGGPERAAQAQAAGLVLLHKPVGASRLRAAVGNLMRRRAG
jgi:signal transduction histidine kinase/CheY-like chemotaxis protein